MGKKRDASALDVDDGDAIENSSPAPVVSKKVVSTPSEPAQAATADDKRARPSMSVYIMPLMGAIRNATSKYMKGPSVALIDTSTGKNAPNADARGSNVIVIHPGSRFLRIGRASDAYPVTVPHCIARRVSLPSGDHPAHLNVSIENSPANLAEMEQQMTDYEEGMRDRQKQARRRVQSQADTFNSASVPKLLPDSASVSDVTWTEDPDRPFYIGHEALRIDPREPYAIRYPFKHGFPDTASYASKMELEADLSAIWTTAIETHLKIPAASLGEYSVFLVVPDVADTALLKDLHNVALRGMGVKAVLSHQEAVCAAFGATLSAACVVDLGAQTTTVSCVDDGWLQRTTRVRMNYGGDDMTRVLHALLMRQEAFPMRDCGLALAHQIASLNELKEAHVSLLAEATTGQQFQWILRSHGDRAMRVDFKVNDEFFVAAHSVFNNHMYRPAVLPTRRALPDPEDVFADSDEPKTDDGKPVPAIVFKLRQDTDAPTSASPSVTADPMDAAAAAATATAAPTAVAATGAANTGNTPTASSASTPVPTPTATPAPPAANSSPATNTAAAAAAAAAGEAADAQMYAWRGVDAAVQQSIEKLDSEEKRKKLLGNVLLVGGGSLVPHLVPILADCLRRAWPNTDVQVVSNPRELDGRVVTWKGGCVAARLENTRDFWITREEWAIASIRLLKERLLYEV